MFAVIRIGNHQYKVGPGEMISVEKLDGPVGSEVRFTDVVLFADDKKVQSGSTSKGSVYGKIQDQYRGEKETVFKRIRRKGFRKKIGHRQSYTKVEITRIEA